MDENINLHLDLPPEATHYAFRIGGHTHVQEKLKLGTLKHKNGNILKPLIKDDIRSVRELSFYQKVFENPESDPILQDLRNFLPQFHGTWETAINGTSVKYLCIEDVCGNFLKPSILDVKIGAITYEPNALKEKIERDRKKYPPVEVIEFRILGMKVYDHQKEAYTVKNKKFGLSLIPETVNAGIEKFFNSQFGQVNLLILSGILHKLHHLKNWFSKQRILVLISSSLLLVYEGDLTPWITFLKSNHMHVANDDTCKKSEISFKEIIVLHYEDCTPVFPPQSLATDIKAQNCKYCKLNESMCNKLQNESTLLRVALIDFAHVLPTTEEDSNYISGLNNFISHLQILLNMFLEKFIFE